jgi:hypothetical protein
MMLNSMCVMQQAQHMHVTHEPKESSIRLLHHVTANTIAVAAKNCECALHVRQHEDLLFEQHCLQLVTEPGKQHGQIRHLMFEAP